MVQHTTVYKNYSYPCSIYMYIQLNWSMKVQTSLIQTYNFETTDVFTNQISIFRDINDTNITDISSTVRVCTTLIKGVYLYYKLCKNLHT